jgi:hypothetical protein
LKECEWGDFLLVKYESPQQQTENRGGNSRGGFTGRGRGRGWMPVNQYDEGTAGVPPYQHNGGGGELTSNTPTDMDYDGYILHNPFVRKKNSG